MPSPFEIVFALYPNVTQLDFTGPFEIFQRMPGVKIECAFWELPGGTTLELIEYLEPRPGIVDTSASPTTLTPGPGKFRSPNQIMHPGDLLAALATSGSSASISTNIIPKR